MLFSFDMIQIELPCSAGKESTCSAADPSSIPGSGRSPWRRDRLPAPVFLGFPDGSVDKESPCNAGDQSSIIGLGRSPGGGHGNPLQYSCPENPHGQRSLAAAIHGISESDMTEWLSTAHDPKFFMFLLLLYHFFTDCCYMVYGNVLTFCMVL